MSVAVNQVIYQPRKKIMFDQISKHHGESWKYNAQRSIFDEARQKCMLFPRNNTLISHQRQNRRNPWKALTKFPIGQLEVLNVSNKIVPYSPTMLFPLRRALHAFPLSLPLSRLPATKAVF